MLVGVLIQQTSTGDRIASAQLIGGRADPGGAWEYGRLEIFDGNFFSIINENFANEEIGRRAAAVACRGFGYDTGAQLLVNSYSVLPDTEGDLDTVGRVLCEPDAASLEDCSLGDPGYIEDVYEEGIVVEGEKAVALLCFSPSGTHHAQGSATSTIFWGCPPENRR